MQYKKAPHEFIYCYSDGPLQFDELSQAKFKTGNCRRAIQDYLYFVHKLYLSPEKILLPQGYLNTGTFVTKNSEIKTTLYKHGDILYAERIRDKNGASINMSRECFKTENEWIVRLHSAVFIDKNKIYHATAITGKTCIWDFETFNKYYKIVAAKRVIKE